MRKIVLVKSDSLDDWYTVEWAEHEYAHEWRPHECGGMSLFYSGRVSDSCVEGHLGEMRALAEAVAGGADVAFNRCAVEHIDGRPRFFSPRNNYDENSGFVDVEAAKEWAAEVLAMETK